MNNIRIFTRNEFSDSLGFADRSEPAVESAVPSPWGVARLIRREVRRKAIVTRRELRCVIEPFFSAASFDGDTGRIIQKVADRMVEVGELADLKVENQRGYSAMPSRWIKLQENIAVLLGTTATETHRFSPFHTNQFLRRFHPSDKIIADLSRIGVSEQSFEDWLGKPEWKQFVNPSQEIVSLEGLLDWYINRLDTEESPLILKSTNILAVDHRPGDFFGSKLKPKNSRWVSCNQLDEGIYVGAQLGQNENHWIPLLIRIQNDACRSLELHFRNDATANIDLRNWLLIALGVRNQQKEVIILDHEASKLQCTFPIPLGIQKILYLIGEPTEKWQQYAVVNTVLTGSLLSRCIPEIRVQ